MLLITVWAAVILQALVRMTACLMALGGIILPRQVSIVVRTLRIALNMVLSTAFTALATARMHFHAARLMVMMLCDVQSQMAMLVRCAQGRVTVCTRSEERRVGREWR